MFVKISFNLDPTQRTVQHTAIFEDQLRDYLLYLCMAGVKDLRYRIVLANQQAYILTVL